MTKIYRIKRPAVACTQFTFAVRFSAAHPAQPYTLWVAGSDDYDVLHERAVADVRLNYPNAAVTLVHIKRLPMLGDKR